MPVTSQESHQSCIFVVLVTSQVISCICVLEVSMPVTSQESHQSCICVLEVSLPCL